MSPSRSSPQPQVSIATEGRGLVTLSPSSLPPLHQDCHHTAQHFCYGLFSVRRAMGWGLRIAGFGVQRLMFLGS